LAFYDVLAAQHCESLYAAGLKDVENVIRVLATRECEGEGSKFDRLRTEREGAELQAELARLAPPDQAGSWPQRNTGAR
jgi:outer membrane protein TolC